MTTTKSGAKRVALSTRARFEVFKRDGFTCQYCGAHPPTVVLECDHIVAVAEGGDNAMDNLVTSCFACNRGKAAVPLSKVPQRMADKAAEVAEREAQIRGFSEVMAAKRQRIEDDTWHVIALLYPGEDSIGRDKFLSVQRFVERLGLHEVLGAAEIALASRTFGARRFKYFCGVCWNKIRRAEDDQ